MTSKEQREHIENVIKPKYATIEISDLCNPEFAGTFVTDHFAEIVPASLEDIKHHLTCDSLSWPYGCMYTDTKGICATYYAAFFILLWLYRKLPCGEANLIAGRLSYIEQLYLNNSL